ncbi:MAG: alpha-E domain-containing protein, partial [Leptospirales bacterium]
PLVQITGDETYFKEHYTGPTKKNVIQFLVFDPDYPNSIHSCLRMARENARSVREIISSEMWQVLNRTFRSIDEATAGKIADRDNPTEFFRAIKESAHLYTGVTDATFSHGEGWHFGNMGRFLERADQTTRIIDMKYFYLLPSPEQVDTPLDLMQWTALLKSASAFEMYRKTHGSLNIRKIVEFLLLDREFPRAVYQCIAVAENSLEKILGEAGNETHPARRAMGRIFSELRYASVDEIFESGVHEYVDGLQDRFIEASMEIRRAFFEPAGVG